VVVRTKGLRMGCLNNQGDGIVLYSTTSQFSSSSLENLLRRKQELTGMSTLDVSTFTSSPFSSLGFIDMDVNTVALSLYLGGICQPLASLPSLFFPLSSISSIFSPFLVTPSLKSGREEDTKSSMFLVNSSQYTTPVGDASTQELPSGSHSSPSLVETLPSTHTSTQPTPSASTYSSSKDNRVRYHIRSRSVVKEDLLENDYQSSDGRGLGPIPRSSSEAGAENLIYM